MRRAHAGHARRGDNLAGVQLNAGLQMLGMILFSFALGTGLLWFLSKDRSVPQ